jgi:hypothetical protein
MTETIYDTDNPGFRWWLNDCLTVVAEDYDEGIIGQRKAGALWELYTNPNDENLIAEWFDWLDYEVCCAEPGAKALRARSLAAAKAQGFDFNAFGRMSKGGAPRGYTEGRCTAHSSTFAGGNDG